MPPKVLATEEFPRTDSVPFFETASAGPIWQNHQFYQTDDFLDIGVIVLKYHPICYFHAP